MDSKAIGGLDRVVQGPGFLVDAPSPVFLEVPELGSSAHSQKTKMAFAFFQLAKIALGVPSCQKVPLALSIVKKSLGVLYCQ